MLIKIVRFLAPDVDDLQSMTAAKWSKVAISLTKYAISTFLFAVCVLVSMALTENPVRIILIWVLIGYLAALEGGQVAMVSLASVPSASYKRSHPRTARCMAVVEKQSVMEQYIMGRQFLVVIVIFLLNIVSSGSNTCHDIALGGFSDAASAICNTGLTLTFVTIMVAQITSQIIASNCRLDFLNKFLMLGNTWLALAIEYSGILHTVHLVRILLSRVSGDDTNETPGVNVLSLASNAAKFFWLRVGLSLFLLWYGQFRVLAYSSFIIICQM